MLYRRPQDWLNYYDYYYELYKPDYANAHAMAVSAAAKNMAKEEDSTEAAAREVLNRYLMERNTRLEKK